MKETISKASWCIMTLSLLIDMISHARSFPSYNIVIGVFAWYAAQSFKIVDGKYSPNNHHSTIPTSSTITTSTSTLMNTLSCFTTMTLFSIILDIVFCFIWGSEIIDGDVRSVKLSFSLFIMNMLPKAVATLCVFAIQIDIHDNDRNSFSVQGGDSDTNYNNNNSISININNDNNTSREIQMIKTGDKTPMSTPKKVRFMNMEDNLSTTSANNNKNNNNEEATKTRTKLKKEEKNNDDQDMNHDADIDIAARQKKNDYIASLFPNSTSPIENVSFDESVIDINGTTLDDVPLPPFSPGVPGLFSPLPRRPNCGVLPPLPPAIRRV